MADSRAPELVAVVAIFCFTSVLFVPLRLYSRIHLTKGFGWDDSFLLMCLVRTSQDMAERMKEGRLILPGRLHYACGIRTQRLPCRSWEACRDAQHAGTDRWSHGWFSDPFRHSDIARPDWIHLPQYVRAAEVTYVFLAATIKASIAAALLRIVTRRRFTYVIWAALAVNPAVLVIGTYYALTDCTPTDYIWNRPEPLAKWKVQRSSHTDPRRLWHIRCGDLLGLTFRCHSLPGAMEFADAEAHEDRGDDDHELGSNVMCLPHLAQTILLTCL